MWVHSLDKGTAQAILRFCNKTMFTVRQILALIFTLGLLLGCQPDPLQPAQEGPPGPLQGTLVDLTYSFDSTTIYWPTASGFKLHVDAKGWQDGGYYYEANSFESAEHGGTHLDAPVHFAEGKWASDEIPLDRLIGPGVVIDISEKALADRDYLIRAMDLKAWEAEHGLLPEGSIVLFRTGYGQYWPDRVQYMGTDIRGAEGVAALHFPGLDSDAAVWLREQRRVRAVGIDTPSIDYGQSTRFEAHQELFAGNIPVFENVANLDALPILNFNVIALPMKITGGSGGPLRIIAIVP